MLTGDALLDGGDVMFDGTCVWCGVSARSNAAAATQLAELLRPHGVPVAAVRVSDPHGATLHLKSVVSTIAPRHVLAAGTPAGRLLVETAMSDDTLRAGWAAAGAGGLQVTYVPDAICANVLRIGGHVVMQKGFPDSEAIIREICSELGLQLHTLDMSELAKADGALTCCSVLVKLD